MTSPEERKDTAPDDVYAVSGPCESSAHEELAAEYMRKAAKPKLVEAAPLPPRPAWPMFSGVFTFPFYLSTLGPYFLISLGLTVTALLFMFWRGPGMTLGLLGARLLGLPTCAAGLLTFSYAFASCLGVVEETFNGWDAIDQWPDIDWKGWVWSFGRVVVLMLEAGLVGLLFQLPFGREPTLPFWLGSLAAFPFVLLGAMAGGEAWAPVGIGRVLASVPRLWWAWALFYAETTAMIVGWGLVTVVGLARAPVATTFYSCPILAAVMLIYARLLGRLARLIGELDG